MKVIEINPWFHYEVVAKGSKYVLVQYTDDRCPGMGEREPFTPEEGQLMALWSPEEEVELRVVTRKVGRLAPTEGVVCGDDMLYEAGEDDET